MRKIRKKIIHFFLGTSLAPSYFLFSCTTNSAELRKFDDDIKIDGDSSVVVGESKQYKIANLDKRIQTNNLIWQVSNDDLATISDDGILIAKKTGKIEITAFLTNLDLSLKKNVFISEDDIEGRMSISGLDYIYCNSYNKYTVRFYPSSLTQDVTWSLAGQYSDATITDDGILYVSGHYPNVTIHCDSEDNKIHLTKNIIVYEPPLPGSTSTIVGQKDVTVGGQYTYRMMTLKESTREYYEPLAAQWYISSQEETQYASVDYRTGILTPKKPGEINLIALSLTSRTEEPYWVQLHITIHSEPIQPSSLKIESLSIDIIVGQSLTCYCKVEPESAEQQVEWTLDNDTFDLLTNPDMPNFLTIKGSSDYIGDLTLTATSVFFPNIKKSIKLKSIINDLQVLGPKIIPIGETGQYTAKSILTTRDLQTKWTVSDENIATIDQNGILTSKQKGIVDVTANSPHSKKEVSIPVKIFIPPESMSISGPKYIDMDTEDGRYYSLNIKPFEADPQVDWKVTPSDHAKFDPETGKLVPLKAGKLTLEARSVLTPSCYDTLDITVNSTPKHLWIYGNDFVKLEDGDQQYTVQTLPESASTSGVEWKTSDSSIATISQNGVLHPIKSGEVKVIAQSKVVSYLNYEKKIVVVKSDECVNIITSPTVGNGLKLDGQNFASTVSDYHATFVSSKYKPDDSSSELPVHKELKKSDIEVIVNSQNIINNDDVLLEHNNLTIPKKYINNSIKINILGAEIADWITWSRITQISEKDLEIESNTNENSNLVEDLFVVGDYKWTYRDYKPFDTCRIIGFRHDPILWSNPRTKVYERVIAPFTFQFFHAFGSSRWGPAFQCSSSDGWYTPKFSDFWIDTEHQEFKKIEIQEKMEAYDFENESIDPLEFKNIRFASKFIDIDEEGELTVEEFRSTFFPLGYKELTGDNCPDPVDMVNFNNNNNNNKFATSLNEIEGSGDSYDLDQYDYYNVNKYHCDSLNEKDRYRYYLLGTTNRCTYYLRNIKTYWFHDPDERIDYVYFINNDGSVSFETAHGSSHRISCPFCPAFCL